MRVDYRLPKFLITASKFECMKIRKWIPDDQNRSKTTKHKLGYLINNSSNPINIILNYSSI